MSPLLSRSVIIKNAAVISGRGRGKGLGIPTINIDLAAVPSDVPHGIYACKITLGDTTYMGAMHYGPRPVFRDGVAFEVHILDETVEDIPDTVDIEIIGFIRAIADFPSPEAMMKRIERDIEEARGMLSA